MSTKSTFSTDLDNTASILALGVWRLKNIRNALKLHELENVPNGEKDLIFHGHLSQIHDNPSPKGPVKTGRKNQES